MRTSSLLITVSSLLRSSATASITFVGTSQDVDTLEPLALEPQSSVDSIDSLVGGTHEYHREYEPGQQVSSEPSTDLKPDVFLVRGSPVDPATTKASPYGLVGTLVTAYAKHSNLSIRPDDVWITILSQFSFYVNARAEELRDKFVDFEGQQELEVSVLGSVSSVDYGSLLPIFLDLISENIKDVSLREWFLPGFTTTTPDDEVVAAATAMCTLQEYFTYTINISCGIPSITLEGTVQDWQLLRLKTERLLDYDDGTGILVDEWVPLLLRVLDNFVESATSGSTNNMDFWDSVAYRNFASYGGAWFSGWVSVFVFFDDKGSKASEDLESFRDPSLDSDAADLSTVPGSAEWPSIPIDKVNPNILTCPVKINDNGYEYNATLFVGQMSFEATLPEPPSEQRLLLKPRNDWALVIQDGEVELEQTWTTGEPVFSDQFQLCWWYDTPGIARVVADDTPTEAPAPPPNSILPCFSSRNTVEEMYRGVIFMHELKIGDRVRVVDYTFSRVYSLGHWDRNAQTEYLQIHYEGAGTTPLEISKDHLLFVVSPTGSRQLGVPASNVVIGDSLILSEGTTTRVTQIRRVTREGAYAPFTELGTLQVNGVLTSSYVTLQTGSEVLRIGTSIKTPFRIQWLAHLATAPRRWVCHVHFRTCENEAYTSDGIASWIPIRAALWYLDHDMAVWVGVAVLAIALCSRFWKLRSRRLYKEV